MRRRQTRSMPETDAFTGWKLVMAYLHRAGAKSKVKRGARVRERREARARIRRGEDD